MKQRLILITAGFPYGSAETFLESEITYLAKGFKEIIILCPEPRDSRLRSLPNNCSVSFYTKELTQIDKLKALLGLFNKTTWKEIKIIRKTYQLKLSKGIISTLLISLYQAQRVAQLCQKKYLKDSELNSQTVFYSYWCDDTALALALLKRKKTDLKCISRMHRWDIYFEESKVNYLPFRTLIAHNLNNIISISQDGIDYAIKKWNVDAHHFILSRLGVEKASFVQPVGASYKIVSCSNIIAVKRVNLIAEALMQINDINIEWTHFGDGVLFDELKKKVKVMPENIQVNLPGRISNQDVLNSYRKIQPHIFINVSSSEGVPVSIMEAMSFGIPCIATDVGGNSEIVNNKNGVLLSANPSLNDIQNAFKEVLKNEEKRKTAYQTWKEQYNAEKNYTEFVGMLVKI